MTDENKSAKVISFINMKGGVGKTTLCVSVADCFSKQGKKVLIVDAGNLTALKPSMIPKKK